MRAAFFALLALAACGGNAARQELPAPVLPQRAGVDPLVAARAEGVEFRAVGDGFVLDMFADRLRLRLAPSGEEFIFPNPEPTYPRWSGSVYETSNGARTLRVEIRNYQPCERPDSTTYPTTVSVTLNERVMEGCGRAF